MDKNLKLQRLEKKYEELDKKYFEASLVTRKDIGRQMEKVQKQIDKLLK